MRKITKQQTIKNLIEDLKNDETLHDQNTRLHYSIGYMSLHKDIRELLEAIAYGEEEQ